jgi:hypothetical protein
MRRIIIVTLVALTGLAGVATADRPHVRDHRGGVSVEPSRQHYERSHYQRHDRPRYTRQDRPRYTRQDRPRYTRNVPHYTSSYYVHRPAYRYVRRPIYVQRPTIAVRYYNYYQRPAVIAENYSAMPGYYWVAGQWNWNGYEWIWTPGHYHPDPSYSDYYSNSYDSTYYQPNPQYDPNYIY